MASTISIVLPVLDERALIDRALAHLTDLKADEILVVDGGSQDGTDEVARAYPGIVFLKTSPGRAKQMNVGAWVAQGEILLFAHVDMTFPSGALEKIRSVIGRGFVGGGFFKQYEPPSRLLHLYAWGLNHLFLGLFHRMVGTNGIFICRDHFLALGGFPEVPLLEDLQLVDRLKHRGRIGVIRTPLHVSARRYLKTGVVRQMLTNGKILMQYDRWRKTPSELAPIYKGGLL